MRTTNCTLVFGVLIFALVYPTCVLGVEPVLIWKYSAGSRAYSPIELADVNGDGVVDVIGGERDNKVVWAIDGKTGGEIWKATFAGDVRAPTCVVDLNGDKVLEGIVTPAGDTIYCVDMRNGNQLWSLKLDGGVSLDPMIVSDLEMDGKLEIIAASDKALQIVDSATRQTKWSIPQASAEPLACDVNGDGTREVLAVLGDGFLHCFSAQGAEMWKVADELLGFVDAGDIDNDGKAEVVFVAAASELRCIDGVTAEVQWSFTVYGACKPGQIVDVNGDGKLEVLVKDEGRDTPFFVYCLDGAGKLLWESNITTYASARGGFVFGDVDGDATIEVLLGTRSKNLVCLDGKTGKFEWAYYVDGEVYGEPAIGDVNGDGKTEVLSPSHTPTNAAYCLTLGGAYNPSMVPWPMRRTVIPESLLVIVALPLLLAIRPRIR